MSLTICIGANTLRYAQVGGHLWVYLNWALGLRSLGCRVIWLEGLDARAPIERVRGDIARLKQHLERYGLEQSIALWSLDGSAIPPELLSECLDLEAATGADLLLNQFYSMPRDVLSRFRRTALLDIDPGLLQVWMHAGSLPVAKHDVYFTTGETVGSAGTRIPEVGVRWHYTPPCVALDWWPVRAAEPHAPFTTVSHWYADEWMEEGGEVYANAKRNGFLPYVELPRLTSQPIELALCLADSAPEEADRRLLLGCGWRVRRSHEVSASPERYQAYVQRSLGEFSCVKPSCVRLQNAWISDRTLCYLASGKPALVQHTGKSRFLPDASGLFRFRSVKEAASALDTAAADYPRQCRLARALAEEYFDARRVAARVLERALS
jgi:hypothetical protein